MCVFSFPVITLPFLSDLFWSWKLSDCFLNHISKALLPTSTFMRFYRCSSAKGISQKSTGLFSLCVCINIHISILLTQSKKFANLFNRNPNNSLKLILKMTPQLDIIYVCVTSLPKLLFCNCDSANFIFTAVLIVMWNIAIIVTKAGTHY